MNVLIIDNDALSIQLLQRYVGDRLECQTVGVRTAAEGVALLSCQDFDLVVLDFDLPDQEGFRLLKRIRSLMTLMQLPVLGMAEREISCELKAFDLGVNDFLPKPLDPRRVIARIRTLLNCRKEYQDCVRGTTTPALQGEFNAAGPDDRTRTLSSMSTRGGGSRSIPCEIPVMVVQDDASHFCKTLEISTGNLKVLAFSNVPRGAGYMVQMVHPSGETMNVEVVERRRLEVAQHAAGMLCLHFEITSCDDLYKEFCGHLERAWRVKGMAGLKDVLKGSMSISRAQQQENLQGGALNAMVGARYRFEKLLGIGGFATVFLVRDLALRRLVAMKVLSPELAADAAAREKFLGEAQISAQFHHANIVFVYEVGQFDTKDLPRFMDFPPEMVKPYDRHFIYFTMQYIEGQSLSERLKKDKRIPVEECEHIFGEVLRALAFAHKKNVIHRDIKPGNIMIDKEGHIIVTDFGIARMVEETEGGSVECTPRYASPEQLLSRKLDGRSDIYSLGITLYEMLSGTAPFPEARLDVLVARVLNEPPPSLRERVPDLPQHLEKIVARCLAKKPDERYASVREIIGELSGDEETETVATPYQNDTLTILLEHALVADSPEAAETVMKKLLAQLQLHQEAGRDDEVLRLKARIAVPEVLDSLLTHTLKEAHFQVLYNFFKRLGSPRVVTTLIQWFERESDPKLVRFLARLAVLASGDHFLPLTHDALGMKDEHAYLLLHAQAEQGRLMDDQVPLWAKHEGERTRLTLLKCIQKHQLGGDATRGVVRAFARGSTHQRVRSLAVSLTREIKDKAVVQQETHQT